MVPDSSRDLIHLFLKDGHVHEKAKNRLIQTITNQFPCQAYLHTRGMTQSPFCAACQRRNIPDQTENVGHIQCWCPALGLPRIAAHHCIWRELISLIQKHSIEKTEDKLAKAWSFPTANEQEAVHKEWTVQDILTYIGRDTTTIHSKIKRFLERIGSPSNDTDVKAFLDKRPDRVAFDETKKKVCLLEFTRAMDAREEWEERKERDKTKRYAIFTRTHTNTHTRYTHTCTRAGEWLKFKYLKNMADTQVLVKIVCVWKRQRLCLECSSRHSAHDIPHRDS